MTISNRSSLSTIRFSDFQLSFTAHPLTGDISRITEEEAIKNSIKNLVLTGYNERPFYPGKGCGVYFLLFENLSFGVAVAIEEHIKTVLRNWEPRITVTDIIATPDYDNNGYYVTVTFEIINKVLIQNITVFLERIR